MTVTIDLTPDEERQLRERAARLDQDLAGYLRRIVRQDLHGDSPAGKRSFGEILAPIHQDFRESGMTEGELDALLEEALGESRAERRRGKAQNS